MVKTSEGDNIEDSGGYIKVQFGQVEVTTGGNFGFSDEMSVAHSHHGLFSPPVKLTPIISDPEYLLDQHILICVKSTDSDESYGTSHAPILTWAVLIAHSVLCPWRRGLCGAASCSALLHGVSDHTDPPGREHGHDDRRHPATHLWGQAYWEAVRWVWMPGRDVHDSVWPSLRQHQFFLFFQILSKLKRTTPLTQKAKVAISTSRCIILPDLHAWLLLGMFSLGTISNPWPCDLGCQLHKHLISQTPITWGSRRATWKIKDGVTACHQRIWPFPDMEVKSPRRLLVMWARAAPRGAHQITRESSRTTFHVV